MKTHLCLFAALVASAFASENQGSVSTKVAQTPARSPAAACVDCAPKTSGGHPPATPAAKSSGKETKKHAPLPAHLFM